MPVDGGTSLGTAQGRITINTSDLNRVVATSQQVGRQVEQNLGRIGVGAAKAQGSFAAMSSGLTQFAGAFGISLGIGAVTQMGRFVVAAEGVATAFDRQSIAAVSLAGSQGKLNDLMRVYDEATGGVINRATALADVTRLQAIGFADTAAELDRFARAARGISIAMGVSQDYVISQLTLAIANQSFMRLDQIGLDASEAKIAIDALKASDKNLTDAMIYQQVIMEQAEEKFGSLADSAEAQATGMERLAKSWADLRLEMGQVSQGPLDAFGDGAAMFIDIQTARLKAWMAEVDIYIRLLRSMGMAGPWLTTSERGFVGSSSSRDVGRHAAAGGSSAGVAGPRFGDSQEKVEGMALDRLNALNDIERESAADRIETVRDYTTSVGDIERDYAQNVTREAEDFALSRQRAEADHLDSIADIREDAGRREADQAADLARTISRSRADSAERIEEAREDAGERLVEMEEDFAKARERAYEDHRDKMLSAAGSLDAIALLEERKRWARESTDAKEAHDEQRSDLQEQLDERIADENESLAKSIANAQEAHDRQLTESRQADERRIEDMRADFEERKTLEDEDRAIRLGRMGEDHQARLDEMARQHALDLAQITTNEAEKRAEVQAQFELDLAEEIGRTAKQQREHDRMIDRAIASMDRGFAAIELRAEIMANRASRLGHPSLADPYTDRLLPGGGSPGAMLSGGSAKVVNIQAGAIVIQGDGLNEREVANMLIDYFEAV